MYDEKMLRQLKESLSKLERTADKIISTRGYTREVEGVKILSELIREQLTSENISRSTRKTG